MAASTSAFNLLKGSCTAISESGLKFRVKSPKFDLTPSKENLDPAIAGPPDIDIIKIKTKKTIFRFIFLASFSYMMDYKGNIIINRADVCKPVSIVRGDVFLHKWFEK